MSKLETDLWQRGVREDTPLPPLVTEQGSGPRFFAQQYRKYGPIFRMARPEGAITVMVGPEANTFIARREYELFTSHEEWEEFFATMNTSETRISQERDGIANRQRRAKESRNYSRTHVLDQLPRMVALTHEFTRWEPEQSVVMLPAMQRVVSEQLGQLLVNYSVGDYLPDLVTYLNTAITSSFGGGYSVDVTPASPAFQRAQARAYELGRAILAAHRYSADRKPDLLDEQLADMGNGLQHIPEQMQALIGLGPFLAGLDTVANSASFMLYALLKEPESLQRVVAEVDAAFAQGPLTWELLKTMQALHGAAMETLRLYPVAEAHKARVAQPFTFAGYRLEPGNNVYVAMTAPHFLPELFPDPETFDIDRYHEPRNEHRKRGAYAPFGLGDHTCLGSGIAEIQLMVIPAVILHTYQLALDPPDYQLTIKREPTPSPGKQLKLRVVARRQAG